MSEIAIRNCEMVEVRHWRRLPHIHLTPPRCAAPTAHTAGPNIPAEGTAERQNRGRPPSFFKEKSLLLSRWGRVPRVFILEGPCPSAARGGWTISTALHAAIQRKQRCFPCRVSGRYESPDAGSRNLPRKKKESKWVPATHRIVAPTASHTHTHSYRGPQHHCQHREMEEGETWTRRGCQVSETEGRSRTTEALFFPPPFLQTTTATNFFQSFSTATHQMIEWSPYNPAEYIVASGSHLRLFLVASTTPHRIPCIATDSPRSHGNSRLLCPSPWRPFIHTSHPTSHSRAFRLLFALFSHRCGLAPRLPSHRHLF